MNERQQALLNIVNLLEGMMIPAREAPRMTLVFQALAKEINNAGSKPPETPNAE